MSDRSHGRKIERVEFVVWWGDAASCPMSLVPPPRLSLQDIAARLIAAASRPGGPFALQVSCCDDFESDETQIGVLEADDSVDFNVEVELCDAVVHYANGTTERVDLRVVAASDMPAESFYG